MATALARVSGITINPDGLPTILLEVAFSGSGVNGVDILPVDVPILATDQPAAIRAKMSSAVSAFSTMLGYSVVGTDMTLPTFQKG